ncbi:E3 ubiquitin-protein ligase rnf213-alpha-like [Watersipora subatra]|uniref:E3 ubiquitin-protein ligase rnf213-alpha-like n=1 Tax=Watersipora subatra TaxID=2589382 RepID=UPI00355BD633
MGETGCGKTKLIEFMSKLQVPTLLKDKVKAMIILKIHGGITEDVIISKVTEAQDQAKRNQRECKALAAEYNSRTVPEVYTILFMDEANTTEAVGLVKEILCDGRMRGKPLDSKCGLKIIAACNPYRKHSEKMITKLKKAGLGYSVSEEDTQDKFGEIPMRHLVYRVQPLSQSLLPLVWDFGTLASKAPDKLVAGLECRDVETAYISRMVLNFNTTGKSMNGLNFGSLSGIVIHLLSATQKFMRKQEDECSFVSLRDIQRTLDVTGWFFRQREYLFPAMDELETKQTPAPRQLVCAKDSRVRSLLLAVGVCYLARLEEATRLEYATAMDSLLSKLVEQSIPADIRHGYILRQIDLCQDLFIRDALESGQHENIAKNKALKENVFMMIVCIENRIPLFLVGKPGSSKSLSKAMVFNAMKGKGSKKDLFKQLKKTYMVSFQCSKLATVERISSVFQHCANLQKGQDLNKFVSVVVLDEVGLAEDSERMPLKALHSLLEDGCEGNTTPEPYMKCAFIGISNWALDPAKMNRGILVQRGTPDDAELHQIANEICKSRKKAGYSGVDAYIKPLTKSYRDICSKQKPDERDLTEFFGLRDFYSLMKMVVNFATHDGPLNRNQLEHSILRNFGGFNPEKFDPMEEFKQNCDFLSKLEASKSGRPSVKPIELIKASLSGEETALIGLESRYLLILTENLSVLSIILNEFDANHKHPEVVFGSRFRDDVSYTQVCHNIYRIRTCMSIGKPVILLNLDDLYESLYDVLNQYFSTLGNKKFVELGLGTHRVETYVHDDFRLVLIADRQKVYSQFPTPLLNRLEKHYVSATSLLDDDQKKVKSQLERWVKSFVTPSLICRTVCPPACDSCHTELCKPYKLPCPHYIGPCCQRKITDAVPEEMCCPCCKFSIPTDYQWSVDVLALENRQFFEKCSEHTAFIGYSPETTALVVREASKEMPKEADGSADLPQVTSFAELLVKADLDALKEKITDFSIEIKDVDLEQYVRETDFADAVREFYRKPSTNDCKLLLVQCESAQANIELLDSVRYITQREHPAKQFYKDSATIEKQCDNIVTSPTHTVLLLNIPRGCQFTGYQGSPWQCVHIDDPRLYELNLTSLRKCLTTTPSQIVEKFINQREAALNATMNTELPPLIEFSENAEYLDDEEEESAPGSLTSENETFAEEILNFVIKCLPVTLSVVKVDQDHERMHLLKGLLSQNEFLLPFMKHVHHLLKKQEDGEAQIHWIRTDAVKASNMKQSETMRKALEDSLERALTPAMAGVVSFIDVRANLLIVNSASFKELWLQIFTNCDKLGLTFEDLVKGNDKLLESYQAVRVGQGKTTFALRFPFSWLVKETLDKIVQTVSQANLKTDDDGDDLEFKSSFLGKIIIKFGEGKVSEEMRDAYLEDFVYMAHPCSSTTEHWIVVHDIRSQLANSAASLEAVHRVYENQRVKFDNLSEIVALSGQDYDLSPVKKKLEDDHQSYGRCDLLALNNVGLSGLKQDEVNRFQLVASNILSAYTDTDDEDVVQCRKYWMMSTLKKLYLDYLQTEGLSLPDFRMNKLAVFETVLKDVDDRVASALQNLPNGKDAAYKTSLKSLKTFFKCFLSEVIFENGKAKAEDLAKWLLERIMPVKTGREKEFSLLCRDLYPDARTYDIMRSFILKTLHEQHKGLVDNYIQSLLSSSSSKPEAHETIGFIVDCYKDMHVTSAPFDTGNCLEMLESCHEAIQKGLSDQEKLHRLAEVQFLTIHSVDLLLTNSDHDKSLLPNMLIKLSELLDDQPRYFIASHLLRTRGVSYIKDKINQGWDHLLPVSVIEVFKSYATPDLLAVFGDQKYTDAQKKLDKVLKVPHITDSVLMPVIQLCKPKVLMFYHVLFSKITRAEVAKEARESLLKSSQVHWPSPMRGTVLKMLLLDDSLPDAMNVKQTKDQCAKVNLAMLVIHMLSSMNVSETLSKPLLSPFDKIILKPTSAAMLLFPTMPDHPDEVLRDEMSAHDEIHDDGAIYLYSRCPRGHISIHNKETKADDHGICQSTGCGSYIAFSGECSYTQAIDGTGRSRAGHTLGPARTSTGAQSVRDLNSLSCAVLRCLTHLCMFASFLFHNRKPVCRMITPVPDNEDVQRFLEAHIRMDIENIALCCARNTDECLLLLHDVIDRIEKVTRHEDLEKALTISSRLQQRRHWENAFDSIFIKPTFEKQTQRLRDLSKTFGKNTVSERLEKLLVLDKPVDKSNLLVSPNLWKYKRLPTLLALQYRLHSSSQQCLVLKKVVGNSSMFVAMQWLPDALRLIDILHSRFHSKFSRKEASQSSIRQFCQSISEAYPGITEKVEQFIKAWNMTLPFLDQSLGLPELTTESVVKDFLIDRQRNRSPAYILVKTLVELHNSMVASHASPPIRLSAVNHLNIVSLRSEDELLSLFAAHSEYEQEETTSVVYNWLDIEQEIKHRYIRNKAKISFSDETLPCYVFDGDFDLHKQMLALDEHQVPLPSQLEEDLRNNIRQKLQHKSEKDLHVLRSLLKDLKIVINLLTVMSDIDGEKPLTEYIDYVFGREAEYLSKTVKLKHVKQTWLLIKYNQTELHMAQDQEPFDDVHSECREMLSEDLKGGLDALCKLNVTRTRVILFELFKYITLELNREAFDLKSDEKVWSEESLWNSLLSFARAQYKSELTDKRKQLLDLENQLENLQVKHAANTWNYLWKLQQKKH